jgi:quinohemoprotein amine dehydrogenase
MRLKLRSAAGHCGAACIVLSCLFAFASAAPTPAAGQGEARSSEEGISVTDALVKAKCGGCHPSDDRGNMQRISWERASPEGWNLALQRMILLDDVELTTAETGHILQYLSTRHGLSPEEAGSVAYDVERRIHEETGIPKSVMTACERCHNMARSLSWRRSSEDWRELSRQHAMRYNAPPNEEALAFLEKTAPLRSPEWNAWRAGKPGGTAEGRWLVTAGVLGRIRYFGEMQFVPVSADGEFETRVSLRSVGDGAAISRTGRGTLYGGYAWRGFSRSSAGAASAPDDLANDAREVLTLASDQSSAEGRWFWGQYQELGFDVKIRRSSPGTTLLGFDRTALKAGSASNRFRLFGDRFPEDISTRDFDFGSGVVLRRIVSHDASEIVAEVDVAAGAPVGKRQVRFRGAGVPGTLMLYDHVDFIKVTPEMAMAAYGNESRQRGYQQFEAIGYQDGPDGKRHTVDDVELGFIDSEWSIRVFYESEGGRTDLVGTVTPAGLFVPASDSPNNNFDVWITAEARSEKDANGRPLVGKSYLVVTVPVYVFNGRRYVRDLDRWVDDGPARPSQQ